MKFLFQLLLPVFLIAGISACSRAQTGHGHDDHDHDHASEEHSHAEAEHTIVTIKKQNFASVIRTSGQIMIDSKGVEIVTAKSSGIVKFRDHYLFPGVKVSSGERLFTISGEQLAEGNTDLRLRQLKSDLDKAAANYERAKNLIPDKIITEESFLEIKSNYEKTLAEYENLSSNFSASGSNVLSPAPGFVRDVFVSEGQMVMAGQPLVSIMTEHSMIIKADVSPGNMGMVPVIEKAGFTVGYSDRFFKTEELGGRRISFGKSMEDNSYYIPVFFRINYVPDLIDGTFAEVYLISNEKTDAITVPNTALMEEFGKYYVFVEDEDGDFIKRYIKTGQTDGENTEVLEGLSEGEEIVATGAYNIKLLLMAGTPPAHTHNH